VRLVIVTDTYAPEINGVAHTLSRLANGLASRGHQVVVLRPRRDSTDRGSQQPGLTERVAPSVPLPQYEGLNLGLPICQTLLDEWESWRPDVVHLATEGPLGWAALAAAERLGIPASSSYHTNLHQYGSHYGLGALRGLGVAYLRHFHNRTACTLAPTSEMTDELARLQFDRLGIMARGVDADLFTPERRSEQRRQSWGAGPEDPVLLYVGRLAPEKNLQLAAEVFLQMQRREPRCRFVLVGDGPARPELERKHPEFVFCGMQRGTDLAECYASADLFLFPSVTETFGNVVTEALASGLVALVFDYAAGRRYIRSWANGVTAPLGDQAAYLRLGLELLERRADWPAMRNAARQTALGVTWPAVIGGFETMLASLVASRRREIV
jgi:glycosyltransferase involved in cell wall biosynthesis